MIYRSKVITGFLEICRDESDYVYVIDMDSDDK